MEEAPEMKEEPRDSDIEIGCVSANRDAENEEPPFMFVEVKSEMEVCS
jgi:hypothetical protein